MSCYVQPVNGKFTIDLSHKTDCFIALSEISVPNINSGGQLQNSIDIKCDQINSTFENPKRLLKRICFNRLKSRGDQYYNQWEANFLDFQQIDSNQKVLSFSITRTFGGSPIEFSDVVQDKKIFLTLALKPYEENDRWSCI